MTSLAAAQKVTAPARSKKVSTAKKANRMPLLKFETPLSSAVAYVARDDHFLKIGYRRIIQKGIKEGAPDEYQYPLACFADHPAPCPFLYLKEISDAHTIVFNARHLTHIGSALQDLLRPYVAATGVYYQTWGPPPPTSVNDDRCLYLRPTYATADAIAAVRGTLRRGAVPWTARRHPTPRQRAIAAIHDTLLAKGLVADYDY